MKDNFKLIGITILFVVTGLILSFFALQETELGVWNYCVVDGMKYSIDEEVIEYQQDSSCICGLEGIIECVPNEVEVLEQGVAFDTTDLEIEGLEFEYSYLMGITDQDSSLFLNSLTFKNISISEENLTVVLEQMQLCPEPNVAPEQVGFYDDSDDVLKLYNMIRPTTNSSSVNCTVQLKYIFEDFADLDDVQIGFVDDNGLLVYASICFYNGKIYSDSDVFRNLEDSICTCSDSVIECE